jgi:dihydrofolate reductase
MIRCIAALDDRSGITKDGQIPWQSAIPSDLRWFREHTWNQSVLMGRATFKTIGHPLARRTNYVASRHVDLSAYDVHVVPDAVQFIKNFRQDLWVIGGADVYTQAIGLADELYLTRVQGDFGCTQFFPAFEKDFIRTFLSDPKTENSINFHFEIWHSK